MSKILPVLLVLIVCLSVSCLATSSLRKQAFGIETSSSSSSSSSSRSFVFYQLGERFVLQQTNGTDKGNTTTNDGFKIEGWGGWLGFSIVILIFFLFGAVFCFMGYKLFKFIVAVIGFIGGFLIGSLITMTVANWFSVPADDQYIVEWVALGVGILLGIIVAFVSWWFYMVGIFLVGGGVGVVVAFYIFLIGYSRIGDPDWLPEVLGWITAALLFILFGLLTLKLQKFMIILGSAAIGAFLILVGPLALLEQLVTLDDWVYWIFVAGFAVLWVAGTLVQYRFTALEDWHEETYNIERRSFV